VRILRSYRWRRRILTTAVLVALAVPVGYFFVHFSKSEPPTEATGPEVPADVFSTTPKHVPLTSEKRQRIHTALEHFISTAVARRHVGDSWIWTGPGLREGLSKREWSSGNIPVQPYPVSKRGLGTWDIVEYSYAKRVGLEVLLWPKRGSGTPPLAVTVDVVPGPKGRWLVDYWLPKRYRGPVAAPKPRQRHRGSEPATAKAKPQAPNVRVTHEAASDDKYDSPQSRIGGAWWALPIALLSLIVLIPLTIWLSSWRKNRRAMASYQRGRS
jgi:hypothetical protein